MSKQVASAGPGPKRPDNVHPFDRSFVAPTDSPADDMHLIAMILGVGALLLKMKGVAWAALFCVMVRTLLWDQAVCACQALNQSKRLAAPEDYGACTRHAHLCGTNEQLCMHNTDVEDNPCT